MYQKINSSIVSKGAMNSYKEMFPLARMFPLAVMQVFYRTKRLRVSCKDILF